MFRIETDIYKWLVCTIPKAHWQRIENTGGLGPGVPDVNCCYRGKETWIELKTAHGFHFQPSQANWMRKRLVHGGRVRLLVGYKTGDLCMIKPPDAWDCATVKGIIKRNQGRTGYYSSQHTTFWPRHYLIHCPDHLEKGLLLD